LQTELVIPPFGETPDPAPYPYPGEPGSRFAITEANAGNPIAKIVLQNIRVLRVVTPSTSESGSQGEDTGNFLVIEVTPDQAELVHMMTTVGTYQVMLRGAEDEEIVTSMGANMELLVTEYELPVPKTIRLPESGAQ
jgi:Flp pilus assembly protein CpaB